ncbi:hypothetical protein K6U70_19605 [Vibrio vulnificus]|uniref:hypothetical protein n=1 Tax=Vibrio vulnificus TaxID=672 RepID=UPI001EE9FBED|nr:hypothetical protein [Vibrio vulnificus]MCG6274321.1 hypothetical protein [Vibrio vulnificus]
MEVCVHRRPAYLSPAKWAHSLLLSTLPWWAMAGELSSEWDWALSYEAAQSRQSVFTTTQYAHRSELNAMLDLQLAYHTQQGQWTSSFALYSDGLYLNNGERSVWWESRDSQWVVRELAWLGEWQVGDWLLDVSIGKLRLDWGVGYGYRPLDLFRPYRQNPVTLVAEEGTGVVSFSHYDLAGEWTLLFTDSSWSQMEQSALDEAAQQRGAGIRRYWLDDDHEWQWIAYYDDVRQGLIGGSVRTVFNEALSLHSSALWQHQSVGYQLPDSLFAPVAVEEQGEAWQALVGVNWASESGHSLLAEYWYDSRAWSKRQWQQAMDRARMLRQQPNTEPLAASYAQGFEHANLVQHNLMLHWSWDSNAWMMWHGISAPQWLADVTPTLDILFSPEDGGVILTQWIRYQWIDTGQQSVELEFAARFLTGDSQSAYAQIEDKHMMVLNLKGRF